MIAALGAVAIMVGLAWFNSLPMAVGLVSAPWDRLAHFFIFFGIAGILSIALGRRRLWLVVGLAVGYALFDEVRQMWLPGRDASLGDFAFDMLGVVAGITAMALARRY
jgi:VanZ family protein